MVSDLVCVRGHHWGLPGAADDCPAPACPVCGGEVISPPGSDALRVSEAHTIPPPPADAVPVEAGRCKIIPGYEVVAELARGGMGVVYKARQLGLNRLVAVKMILSGAHAGPQDLARFRLEAEAAARLQHPHIVPIYEVGKHDGCPFFSMELMEGGSLVQLLDGTPWRSRRAAGFIEVLARAMHAAHQHGIIHRDLKPANILLAADGTPKISDFGIAKKLDAGPGDGGSPLTNSFALLGTPSYMPPEQAEGASARIGPATDVYSLGAILYQMLTGRPPFHAATPVETVLRLLEDEPKPPRRCNPHAARDLEAICLKCLEKDPARRYASARELADDLRRFLNKEPIRARCLGPLGRLAWWARHRPALAATLLVLLVFYTNHLLLLLLGAPGEAGFFHQFVTALILAWAAGAVVFQRLVNRHCWERIAIFGWAAMDVLFFTALLGVKDGPASPLLVGYLLLIAVAALRFRPRLVWFVTEMSLASYAGLVVEAGWRRQDLAVAAPQVPLVFALSLVLMGVLMNLLLRRVRLAIGERSSAAGPSGP